MISENAKRYENVVIRNDKEIGINNFGLDYLVSLEQEIEELKEETEKLTKEWLKSQEKRRKAIEYMQIFVDFDECLINGKNFQKAIDILRGSDKE